MTSLRKILANQQNAKRSTGPKTLHGRARASRNAIRHGLTLSPLLDPVFSAAVKKLARQLVGSEADRELYETACEFAEAQLELNRVRHQRHRLIARAHAEPFFETKEIQKKNSRLARRYYVAARRGRLLAFTAWDFWIFTRVGARDYEREPILLSDMAKRLAALTRYERRARSRRTRAIRAYDALLQRPAEERTVDAGPNGEIALNNKTKPNFDEFSWPYVSVKRRDCATDDECNPARPASPPSSESGSQFDENGDGPRVRLRKDSK